MEVRCLFPVSPSSSSSRLLHPAVSSSGTLVKVKPDGSGTIEQTMLVNAATLKGLMAGMGGQAQIKELPGALNEADFKRTAERMGVRPVSHTPLKEGEFEGPKSVFAFDDITKVRVDQDPQMTGLRRAHSPAAPTSNAPIKFAFASQGGNSVLTVTVDEKTSAPGTKPEAGAKPTMRRSTRR